MPHYFHTLLGLNQGWMSYSGCSAVPSIMVSEQ